MHLTLFINPTGHHQASWRHPEAEPAAGIDLDHYKAMARLAERAKFDAVFLADNQCVRAGPPQVVGRVAQYVANFEPLTLLGALAAATDRIGLVATASTSFNYPYQVARKFASLDHLSKGRIGWNIVTSGFVEEAYNFGLPEHYEHDHRYEIAREFVDVCRKLWDSWDDDAFVRDKESGVFSDQDKVHVLNHVGRFFRVRGPLNVPRPPQGYPVHVQAGSSEAGKAFAAQYAEMMFVSPLSIDTARDLYREMKERVAALGRDPAQLKIMPGMAVIVGRSKAEAQEKFEQLQSLLHPDIALQFLSQKLGGVDLSGYPIDGPLPADLPKPTGATSQSHFYTYMEKAQREQLTIRQLAQQAVGSMAGFTMAADAAEIADFMEAWVREGACDGFNIQPSYMPGAFVDFVDLVVPELQRRGLARSEYSGRTLRDHFGLARPESSYSRI